jgi:hypothetical protein
MQEKENVLRILEETKIALKNNDAFRLKELSNQTIHTASMSQDSDNIAVAVIVYSLSKIIERTEYKTLSGWNSFYRAILAYVDNLILALRKNQNSQFKEGLKYIRNAVSNLSGNLKFYIQDVFRKAEINKASKIYEHGISMEKTAHLLGITMFELASYAGQKQEMGVPLGQTLDVKSRIKIAEDIFK